MPKVYETPFCMYYENNFQIFSRIFYLMYFFLVFQTFQPETTDIYDKKNMPRVIYCIHALSTHLFKLGKAPQIQDLFGKVNFTGVYIFKLTLIWKYKFF